MEASRQAPWQLSGTYLEACNCQVICPCRRIDGTPGGRSTYGECLGALSWIIESGEADGADLAGLHVAMACRYHDDEPGSPWSWVLYVDERGDEDQRSALERIWTGQLGGTAMKQFPWAWKDSNLIGVRPVGIEIDHTPGRGWFRAGGEVSVRIRGPIQTGETVTCIIPGHERSGEEVHSDLIRVAAGELAYEFTDRCGYETTFDYSSD
jgi:hypothetical protein